MMEILRVEMDVVPHVRQKYLPVMGLQQAKQVQRYHFHRQSLVVGHTLALIRLVVGMDKYLQEMVMVSEHKALLILVTIRQQEVTLPCVP